MEADSNSRPLPPINAYRSMLYHNQVHAMVSIILRGPVSVVDRTG